MSHEHDDEKEEKQVELQEVEKEDLSCPTNLELILDFGKDGELCPETFRLSEVSPTLKCGGDKDDQVSCYEDASIGSPLSSLSSFDPCDLASILDGPDLEPLPSLPSQSLAAAGVADELGCLSSNQNEPTNSITNGYAVSSQAADHLPLPQFSTGKSLFSPHDIPRPLIPPPPIFQNHDGSSIMPVPYVDSTNLRWSTTSFPIVDPIRADMGIDFQPTMEMPISGGRPLLGNPPLGAFPTIPPLRPPLREGPFVPLLTTSHPRTSFPSNVSSNPSGACDCPMEEVAPSDESSFKVRKLTSEEREEKLSRYRRKRKQRNFGKKIKYACRKTLADSRPRVRGRFAKNDDPGEVGRPSKNSHDREDGANMLMEDVAFLDSASIFANLDSRRCSYILDSFM